MAITQGTKLSSNITAAATSAGVGQAPDRRRLYDFSDRVAELAPEESPFFVYLSQVAKVPTDDSVFRFLENRSKIDWTSRNFKIDLSGHVNSGSAVTAGSSYAFTVDSDGASVDWLIKGMVFAVNTTTGAETAGYAQTLVRVESAVTDDGTESSFTGKIIDVSNANVSGYNVISDNDDCQVIGTAFAEGSGYPESWKDQPYSTGYGQTQIWKTSMAMTNTARATGLKYEQNEWARIWKEKLVEHKWDIEQSLLFGQQNETYRTTQGAVDWVGTYGNAFSLDTATKTQDDFLDDLSAYLDPRYNNGMATVFFVSTAVYNWLHKLGGYFNNNLSIGSNFRADFAVMGKKKVMGLDATTISTVYGDMNVVRNIHLDGTNIKMLGVNMKYCAYRPLVGNGINRDTSVYVGVQTLENSGVDRRVDQILTEAGMEWCCPETHAVWTA